MTTASSIIDLERRTATWSMQHHGIVTLDQLAQLGWSVSQIRYRVRTGRWRRLHRGVYQLGTGPATRKGAWLAAVEAMGPRSFLTGEAAADLCGYLRYPSRRIDVATPSDPRHALIGVQVHRTRWITSRDLTQHDGIRVASSERLAVDYAELGDPYELVGVLHQMQRRKRLNERRLIEVSRRLRNRRQGTAALIFAREQIRAGSTGLRSWAELRLVQAIREAGLPFPLVNVIVKAERGRMMIDLWWPEFHCAIEVDDPGHRARTSRLRDEVRDEIMDELGIPFVRITNGEVVYEIEMCVDEVRALLRRAGWKG